MKNKILFTIILILTMSFSCAFGVDYQPEIEEKLTILENKGVIPQGFTQWVFNTSSYKSSLISECKSSSNLGYYFLKTGTTGNYNNKFIISFSYKNPLTNDSNNSNNSYYYYWNFNMFIYNISSTSYSNSTTGGISMRNVVIDYAYTTINIQTRELTLGANEEYGGSYLSGPIFEFDPYDVNGYITVYGSGEFAQFIRRPFSYSNMETRLGYITNIDDYYYLEGKFGPFVTPNIVDAQYGFIKNQVGTYNGKLVLNVNGEILINTAKLVNNQGYSLYFIYKMSPDDDYHYSDYYYYYTYKYGTNPTSGDVVSPELESNIDIGMVNALDDYFNYTSGDAGNIDFILGTEVFNFGFSGDILSGDFLSGEIIEKLGFNDYTKNNRYSLFIYNTYRNILSTLNSSDLNSTISFSLYGVNYSFNSSEFALPNGPIKSLVSTFVYVLFIGCFIRFMHILYLKLSVFDINGFVSSFDSDHSIFM